MGRKPLLSSAGVSVLNENLLESAKKCRFIKEHQFGAVLRTAISAEKDNSFVDITIIQKCGPKKGRK